MRNTALTITFLSLILSACGTDRSDTFGSPLGPISPSEDTSDESGSDGGEDTGGSTGGTTEPGGSTGGSTGGETTGEPSLPQPGEPCDPIAAADEIAPCESPDGDPHEYSCTFVVVEHTAPPNEKITWGYRCVQAKDTEADGFDVGDSCLTGQTRVDPATPQSNSCMNAHCTEKYDTPLDMQNSAQKLSDALCPDRPNQPELTACCMMLCTIGSAECGVDMKCIGAGYTVPPDKMEDGAPTLGYCVSKEYSP